MRGLSDLLLFVKEAVHQLTSICCVGVFLWGLRKQGLLPWRAQRPLAPVPVALQLPVLNPIEGLLEASRRGQYPWMLLFYMLFQRLRLRDLCS